MVYWLGVNGAPNDHTLWQVRRRGDTNASLADLKNAGGSLAWLAVGAVLALAVGARCAVAAWRKRAKRAGTVARSESREPIYEGGGLDADSGGKESNPVQAGEQASA